MPNRLLTQQNDFTSICLWLKENLLDENRIKACCKETGKVPTEKGLYFWFTNQDGYKALNKFLKVKPLDDRYVRKINSEDFDLVYIGTAGVRNNSNGINNGHLQERVKWHLCNCKTISCLCSGHISTLRSTIGSLINSDLIDNDTQVRIVEVFCKYFYVYYLKYPGSFQEVQNTVSSDEEILIRVIRPIFNLKNNPNIEIVNNITSQIQQRRQNVERSSKDKWCKDKKQKKNKNQEYKLDTKQSTLPIIGKCVEFRVRVDQSIHNIINTINNLPNPSIFICKSSNDNDVIVYKSERTNGWRKTGKGQDIYAYFKNSDDGYANRNNYHSNIRWKIIQEEMELENIPEITVTVCPR
jgi:hypothetical protein